MYTGFQYMQSGNRCVVKIYDELHLIKNAKIFLKRGGKWNRAWLKYVVGKIKNKLVTLCLGRAKRKEIYEWRLMMNGSSALALSIMAEAISSQLAPNECLALIRFGFALAKKASENIEHILDHLIMLIQA